MNAKRLLFRSLLFLSMAMPLEAQDLGFLTNVFKDVHSVTLFGSFAEIRKSPQLGTRSSQCLFLGVCGGGAEVLFDLTPEDHSVHLELGLGASYLRGFKGKEMTDSFDLRSSVRSFPEFGAYLSGPLFRTDAIIPYFGGTFGLSDLWNGQVYAADAKQVSIKGQTFDYGIVVGFAVDASWAGNAFVEGGWHGRRFPGIEYGVKDTVPRRWPRELDLSGWEFSVGWQFELKQPKKEFSIEGVWFLATVDWMPPPGILIQAKTKDGATRVELTGGELRLENGYYTLSLDARRSDLTSDFKVAATQLDSVPRLRFGKYDSVKNAIILSPKNTARTAIRLERIDDQLVFTNYEGGHRLSFKKSS